MDTIINLDYKIRRMMQKNDIIFITGANGMVGSALTQRLKTEGFTNLLAPGSKELDLRNQSQVNSFFEKHQVDFVFHLAGHVGGIGGSVARPVEFLYENEIMALNVIFSAYKKGIKKLLFLGSSCVYPRLCSQPMKEEYLLTGPLEPTNEGYALAKISGMKLCEYLNHQYKTNFISLMPCNLYGYKDHFETQNSHVISALIYKFHQAKVTKSSEVEIWGSGKARREFLFAEDMADAMLYFITQYGAKDLHPFVNIGSGFDVTISELAMLIKEIVGFSGNIRHDSTKPDGMPQKLLDVTRASALGWKAQTSLQNGIRQVYHNYLQSLQSLEKR